MKTNIVGDFIELHDSNSNNPILIRKSEIKTVYMSGKAAITSIIVGNREFDVNESYEKVRGMLVPPDSIQIKYSEEVRAMIVDPNFISIEYDEEEKKRIEKYMEQWNKTGCTTFSSLGMTDDEWHQVIAGLSNN